MPRASAGVVKYHYLDHDSDVVQEIPPVQNTWYTLFEAEDVRLLLHVIHQVNDDTVAKDLEFRWTINGTEYLGTTSVDNDALGYVYRNYLPSTGGTLGLSSSPAYVNAFHSMDKRGQDIKVEVRMTSVPGTNQQLNSWAVRETLELT